MFDEAVRRAIQFATLALSVILLIELLVQFWRRPRARIMIMPVLFLAAHFATFYSVVLWCDHYTCEPRIFLADWSSILRFHSITTLCLITWDNLHGRIPA